MASSSSSNQSGSSLPKRRQWIIPIVAIVLITIPALFWSMNRHEGQPLAPPVVQNESQDAFFMPAEFHPQDILLLGGNQLAELHPDVLAAVVQAAAPEIRIVILAGSSQGKETVLKVLTERGLATDELEITTFPTKTMWVRDFGPATVSDRNGFRSMVDFHYRERRGNTTDDGVPPFISKALGLNLMGSQLLVEGGDYLSNGRGLCLLSTRVINRNAHYLEMEPDQTMANFAAILGFENLLLMPPLQGETTGHVDMFCTLLEPDLALVGSFDASVDPENSEGLDGIVTRLKNFPTLDGPMRVERIPMPPHDDGVWRTYTNIIMANGVILVPIYPDHCPDLDREALATYRRLMPNKRIVGVDASGLIKMNGALRCITMNIPRSISLEVE